MDWTQTLTIILTIGASTAAVWYVAREDIKLVREELHLIREGIKAETSLIREDIKRHDAQFCKMDERYSKECSKRDALWADLLKQIHDIKLHQSIKI